MLARIRRRRAQVDERGFKAQCGHFTDTSVRYSKRREKKTKASEQLLYIKHTPAEIRDAHVREATAK